MAINNVILEGRLTKNPEVRATQGENPMQVARFTLAVNRKVYKKDAERQADFISCVAFGKTAEFIEKYFQQGSPMAVTGHIQTGSYTNKEGQKVYTTDVVVDDVAFTEGSSKNSGGEKSAAPAQAPAQAPAPAQAQAPAPPAEELPGFSFVDEEGLPFA